MADVSIDSEQNAGLSVEALQALALYQRQLAEIRSLWREFWFSSTVLIAVGVVLAQLPNSRTWLVWIPPLVVYGLFAAHHQRGFTRALQDLRVLYGIAANQSGLNLREPQHWKDIQAHLLLTLSVTALYGILAIISYRNVGGVGGFSPGGGGGL